MKRRLVIKSIKIILYSISYIYVTASSHTARILSSQNSFCKKMKKKKKQKDTHKKESHTKLKILIEFRKKSKNTSEREEIFFCYEMNSTYTLDSHFDQNHIPNSIQD